MLSVSPLPVFKPWRTIGTNLLIMGLATIDPHSHKVQTKLYKIHKFGVNRPKSKQDTAIWKYQNLRNVWSTGRCPSDSVRRSVRMPYISLLILTFSNRCISVKSGLSNTKLGNLVNLGVLFTFWLCRSIVANPIIYRLVPSPLRFENRQSTHASLAINWEN